ncbi:MAG: prepilin-type N-terminal cleavage/methylation domain-containing protein [Bacteroidota bacterium]
MSSQFLSLNRWLALARQRSQSKGFTLLELLISLIVASVVVSGLLYMVVELTKIDKREATVDQVQRDMNRAMDYLVSDLQEAVYVYKDPAQVPHQ